MNQPFWERTYQDDTVATFTKGPTKDVAEYYRLFPPKGKVLDVGCGEGQHAYERIIARKPEVFFQ